MNSPSFARSAVLGLALALLACATPALALRELTTDRPDRTESPFTVDARHFQLEMDGVAYAHDREKDATLEAWGAGLLNLKAGVHPSADVQFLLQVWDEQKLKIGGEPNEVSRGVGDGALRFKWNFRGNDGGDFALGMMPFVSAPLRENVAADRATLGLIVPASWTLTDRLGLGAMAEVDLAPDGDLAGHHADWIASASLARDWTPALGSYLELYGLASPGRGSECTLDTGFTLGIGVNFQLDAGANFGISGAAQDVVLFCGVSMRR